MPSAATRPAVSVVIAAFNAEATLGEQLKALSRQDFEGPFEILVCDNGSDDATVALSESWRSRALPQLRVIDASHRRGPGAARNSGASEAVSPDLLFCDADDVVADSWVRRMRSALDRSIFVAGLSRRPELNSRPGSPLSVEFSTYRVDLLPQLPVAGALNMGIRASTFMAVGGFDESLRTGEDLDLCWRVQLAGHRLETCDAEVQVRNRDSLTGLFRQGWGYGVVHRQMRHKYANVRAAFHEIAPAAAAQPTPELLAELVPSPPSPEPRVFRRIVRKLFRTRRLSDLSAIAQRGGIALGKAFGPLDRSLPQLPAPTVPAVVER